MIGDDATNFFNYISSFTRKPHYKKLIASPFSIRDEIMKQIDVEIQHQQQYGNGHIIFKVNQIKEILCKPVHMSHVISTQSTTKQLFNVCFSFNTGKNLLF